MGKEDDTSHFVDLGRKGGGAKGATRASAAEGEKGISGKIQGENPGLSRKTHLGESTAASERNKGSKET